MGPVHYALRAQLIEHATPVPWQVEPEALSELQLGPAVLTPSRNNGFLNMLEAMRKRTRALSGGPLPSFPSLRISAADITPQGTFAEAQAQFLHPIPAQVDRLVKVCAPVPAFRATTSLLTFWLLAFPTMHAKQSRQLRAATFRMLACLKRVPSLQELSEKRIGVVAHFYMDPEVQGVLAAAQGRWPHIHISDSLVMADSAVKMAEGGCQAVAVLGVDFMSENVRAVLDEAGYKDVKVSTGSAAPSAHSFWLPNFQACDLMYRCMACLLCEMSCALAAELNRL